MSHPEQSNEDIQREAERFQRRSSSRRKQERAYKKAGRKVLAGLGVGALIAGGSYTANKGGEKVEPAEASVSKEVKGNAEDQAATTEAPPAAANGEVTEVPVTNPVAEDLYPAQPEATQGAVAPSEQIPEESGGVSPEDVPPDPDASQGGGTAAPTS